MQGYIALNQAIRVSPGIVDRLDGSNQSVFCLDTRTGKTKTIPFHTLYAHDPQFWDGEETRWVYYLDRGVFESILLAVPSGEPNRHPAARHPDEDAAPLLPVNYGEDYDRIVALSVPERLSKLRTVSGRLLEYASSDGASVEEITRAIVETSREVTLINKATLMEALLLDDAEAERYTREMVKTTTAMMKIATRLISPAFFNDDLVRTLVQNSNGTVVQHMTRVFLRGVSFLMYYNHLTTDMGIAQRLRGKFEAAYRPMYRRLLSHLEPDDITLERVFYKGMRSLREKEVLDWSIGFLIHDIGKAQAIEYHESEAAYNRETVMEHVKVGYSAVMNKTSYPREAGLITGYHHEYYGDPEGYGYFRSYLDAYRYENPKAKQDFCIAFEMEPLLDVQTLAYFPAKILEIVDVFDSLTDPNRKYRKPMEPDMAMDFMRKEFVETRLKLDPILFDIFHEFMRDRKR